ncbi:serum amyloid P-component-like [Acanthochromis polyacanthus]|uniref:serum amyloid P-component-like n=1 Tax=Acanthochromis polyacanthus TaxID=80966 RepID=UPI000B8F0519|nr:serum amyloid P-component-like [Acanthochromis polyacanthus]
MMKLFVLVMLMACPASPQDMSGKMLIFTREGNFLYARKSIARRNFHTVTVCFRSAADLKRGHTLFSLATIYSTNQFVISWDDTNKEMEFYIDGRKVTFEGIDYKPNVWHSVCTTWSAQTGLLQLWFDGQRLMNKYSGNGLIRGPVKIVLGQREEYYNRGYKMEHSFMGSMSDVHMWDYILSNCDIQNYMNELSFPPGNVLNWKALDLSIAEGVLTEDKVMACV